MKAELLTAAAALALVASGVVARAQDNPNANHEQRPAAERAEPRAPQAAPHQGQQQPRAAETQRRDEPMRNEANAPNQPPRAAQTDQRREAPGQGEEHRRAAQSDEPRNVNEPHRNDAMRPAGAQDRDRVAEPNGARDNTPAARTGENERMRNDNMRDRPRTAERPNGGGAPRVVGNFRSSPEHAMRIGEALRRDGHREHVDFGIDVGARVPRSVEVYPLPEDIVGFAPEYRGYDYFVDDNDEIVFVSPETHEVVGAIDYDEGRAADEGAAMSVAGARPCPIEK